MDKLKAILENINAKNFNKALDDCNEYIKKNTLNKHIVNNLKGVIHYMKDEFNLAEKEFLASHNFDNNYEDPIKNLYLVYIKKKDPEKALDIAIKLYTINNLNDLYNYQLAYAYEINNNLSKALDFYQKCIELNGKNKIKALNNSGKIYLKSNKPKISLKYFLDAYNFNKEDKIIINNLLLNYIKLRDVMKSDEFFRLAENVDNTFAEFLLNKVEYFILKEKYDEAIDICINHKIDLRFLIILIRLYFKMGKDNEAKDLLENTRDKFKNNNNFYSYIGLRSLYEGNFQDGWKYYEYRGSKINDLLKDVKEWNGENLENKSIVVFSEQGLGDTIQFSRYLLSLIKICNDVNFVVSNNILNLFKKDKKNLQIETKENTHKKKYDYKISLGSLIKFFYLDIYNNNDNLLSKDQITINKWRVKIDDTKPNIGIVWSGSFLGPNEPFRSIPLKSLDKLLSLDINFYSLQNEIWERDLDYFKKSNLHKFGQYDLAEIASIIENLDLVISVDTSILHLSCSLNKETWGMFNINPDWRWGEFNKINPYPSLKMIKQTKFNQWEDVVNKMYRELQLKYNLV